MYDATWDAPGKLRQWDRVWALGYLGVVFSAERADVATWTNDATVLDDPDHGWPLLRQPWKGEDYTIKWEASPILSLHRAGASADQIARKIEELRETLQL